MSFNQVFLLLCAFVQLMACSRTIPSLNFSSETQMSQGMAMIQQLRQQQLSAKNVLHWRYLYGQHQPTAAQQQQLMALHRNQAGRLRINVGPVFAMSQFESLFQAHQRAEFIVYLMRAYSVSVHLYFDPSLPMNTVNIEWGVFNYV